MSFLQNVETALALPGPSPATTPDIERAGNMLCLMSCYGEDRQFIADYRNFFQKHQGIKNTVPFYWHEVTALLERDSSASIQTYSSDLHKLTTRWGLHRTLNDWGNDAMHCWFVIHSDAPSCPMHWGVAAPRSNPTPEVGEAIAREIQVPMVRATLADVWYADRESRTRAKQRLMAKMEHQIEAELDRVALHYKQAGYEFQDKRPMLARNIRWLYRRVAYRESCDVIAAHEQRNCRYGYHPQFVQRETKGLANNMGLQIPRPYRSSTF